MTGNSLSIRVDFEMGSRLFCVQRRSASQSQALLGPSGSGKTTLLRILSGIERRAKGSISFGAETWQDSEKNIFLPPWERSVGWVPQEALLFPHLSVLNNLVFSNSKPAPAEVERIASLVGVEHLLKRKPRHLSGGERSRVALGRALLSRPRLLLLDEPFSALDEGLRNRLMEALGPHCEAENISVILVTHHRQEAHSFCREVWNLETSSEDGVLQSKEPSAVVNPAKSILREGLWN